MATSLRLPMATSIPSSSSFYSLRSPRPSSVRPLCALNIPQVCGVSKNRFNTRRERWVVDHRFCHYDPKRHKTPPPDFASLLFDSRVVHINLPFFNEVVQLLIAELFWLQFLDSKEPISLHINSTGTILDHGEPVTTETSGFAVYDALMHAKVQIHTLATGSAVGAACLLLAAGSKGKRFMLTGATAVIQAPRVMPSGLMPASRVLSKANEVLANRDRLVNLLAKHTGNSVEVIAKTMRGGLSMGPVEAIEFGVIDKIYRGTIFQRTEVEEDELDGIAAHYAPGIETIVAPEDEQADIAPMVAAPRYSSIEETDIAAPEISGFMGILASEDEWCGFAPDMEKTAALAAPKISGFMGILASEDEWNDIAADMENTVAFDAPTGFVEIFASEDEWDDIAALKNSSTTYSK